MIEPVTIGLATLYNADALAILPQLSGLNALLCAPPYSSGGQFRSDRVQDTRAKYVPTGSSSQALPDFSGDNRDQRAFAYWAARWAAAALQACRRGAVGMFFTDWRQLPASTDYKKGAAGYGVASCHGASPMRARSRAALRRSLGM
ncbi:hypothetical protein [Paraburkholderia tuberum]|uniref:hypothetical protein n=1 Tax=Paraburkholderia TaxID=1822464 RepID=UPI00039D61DB|nr:hypothetical protein [Paraburkholderia tuberum]